MTARHGSADWYRRWILANALAEVIGLGGSALLLFSLAPRLDELSLKGLAMLAGTLIEGSAVGLLQGLVLRTRLPAIGLGAWWLATLAGAGMAWVLGMLPSLLMDFGQGPAAPAEPPLLLILLLAAGMGLVLGVFLAAPQAWVLRRSGQKAGAWVRYNMLAWMIGLPAVFAGVQTVDLQAPAWRNGLSVGLSLLLAGALVGAVHGRYFASVKV